MPELPEVETTLQTLKPYLEGKLIDRVEIYTKKLRVMVPENLGHRMEGRKISRLSRRAKYMIWALEGGAETVESFSPLAIIIHLGMSGRFRVEAKDGQAFQPLKHDHMMIECGDSRIIFNDARRFGLIDDYAGESVESCHYFKHLGPEPLSDAWSLDTFFDALKSRQTSIKQMLLDQKIVVGIGNIYANEALYMAGIHPMRAAKSLEFHEVKSLMECVRAVLRAAIAQSGSTLRDYRRISGEIGGFQEHFQVYDREGKSCPTCEKAQKNNPDSPRCCVQRIVQNGRSSFFCATKQV